MITSKRLHMDGSSESSRCYLEEMPTEILQQIMLTALNGNLIKASPRVAVKLSGSQAFYQALFTICFYSPDVQVGKIQARLKFHLLTHVPLPLRIWDLRSLTHLVLDSRWCTWGWVRDLLHGHFVELAKLFEKLCKNRVPNKQRKLLREICSGRKDLLEQLAGREIHGDGFNGVSIGLGFELFDLYITSSKFHEDEDLDALGEYDLWSDLDLWRLKLHAFGSVPLPPYMPDWDYSEQTPFREIIGHALGFGFSDGHTASDLWGAQERRTQKAIEKGDAESLRDGLQIDYFFQPEDVPYKISPKLFELAAQKDYRDDQSHVLQVLFEVDPDSLPKGARAVKKWAYERSDTCLHYQYYRTQDQEVLLDREFGTSQLPHMLLQREGLRRHLHRRRDLYRKDIAILRHLEDGVLPKKPDLLSPRLAVRPFAVQQVGENKELFGTSQRAHHDRQLDLEGKQSSDSEIDGDCIEELVDLESLSNYFEEMIDKEYYDSVGAHADDMYWTDDDGDSSREESDVATMSFRAAEYTAAWKVLDPVVSDFLMPPDLLTDKDDEAANFLDRPTCYTWYQKP